VVALVAHQVMSRQDHTVAADTELMLVLLVVLMVAHQVMNRQLHTELVLEALSAVVVLVVHHHMIPHQSVMVLELVVVTHHQLDLILHQSHTVVQVVFKHMQLMLKVSIKIQIHKSSVVQLQVVFKPTHKTSKFASFNHHLSHPQAHSSSKKCAHLSHHHHHPFASVNKLLLALNPLHLFFVNVHHALLNHALLKLLSVV